ncbi:MAG: hydantoinase/oxoprolinase family protein [bacterium]
MGDYSLGIDIGGTFTDIVVYDHQTGAHLSHKELTTTDDPARGVISGLVGLLAREKLEPRQFRRVVHATTLFTNALIERKGAKTGLITTKGFRDVLEMGRERKFELYDIFIEMPEPLVPRNLRLEVDERLGARGQVVRPLDEQGLEAAAAELLREGVQSIAVVLLHAYANPAHERKALQKIAEKHPEVFLTASCEVAPEIREYERTSTTVVNAYVKPLADRYLGHLARQLAELDIGAPLLLMLSSGGLTHVEEAKRVPVQLLESGPAAGALAAAWFGGKSGARQLLAFDMGGTTAKLSLIDGGEPLVAYQFEAARQKRFIKGSGFPLKVSTIELIEIGAGGGSIAHVDQMGLLKVGPKSAGSSPGPACYGAGGALPTVTDADLLLGYLNPDFFVGGAMKIDPEAARRALAGLQEKTGLSETELAWGVHDIVNENMAGAARVHIAERGRDPRHYSLLATGGAGPVHAYYVARKLGLGRLICPPSAGVASALGLLVAPARADRVASLAGPLEQADWEALEAVFKRLERETLGVIADTGLPPEQARVTRLADMRYVGQAFELVIDLPEGPYTPASGAAIMEAFERAYLSTFTRLPPDVPVEFVNARVSTRAAIPAGDPTPRAEAAGGASSAGSHGGHLKGSRNAYFPEEGGFLATPVYDRYRLGPGESWKGPAIVEERESTLIVGPNAKFEVDGAGNLLVALPK